MAWQYPFRQLQQYVGRTAVLTPAPGGSEGGGSGAEFGLDSQDTELQRYLAQGYLRLDSRSAGSEDVGTYDEPFYSLAKKPPAVIWGTKTLEYGAFSIWNADGSDPSNAGFYLVYPKLLKTDSNYGTVTPTVNVRWKPGAIDKISAAVMEIGKNVLLGIATGAVTGPISGALGQALSSGGGMDWLDASSFLSPDVFASVQPVGSPVSLYDFLDTTGGGALEDAIGPMNTSINTGFSQIDGSAPGVLSDTGSYSYLADSSGFGFVDGPGQIDPATGQPWAVDDPQTGTRLGGAESSGGTSIKPPVNRTAQPVTTAAPRPNYVPAYPGVPSNASRIPGFPIYNPTSPGMINKSPTQPPGSVMNVPGVRTSPVNSNQFGGVDMNTIMVIGIGLILVLVLTK